MKAAIEYAISDRRLPPGQAIRVMLVDDSLVARSIFSRILQSHEDVEIVCEAANTDEALKCLGRFAVDIILLDIEMPRRSGLDALPDILAKSDGAQVLVLSAVAVENGPAAVKALSLGAADTLAKPGRTGFGGLFSQTLIDKVVRIGRSGRSSAPDLTPVVTVDADEMIRPACIAIGASTGGIPAITQIIEHLDPKLDCPIFITQHLPDAFMTFFARQLSDLTPRTVMVAEPGVIVQNDTIYIAPGEAHLRCRREGQQVVIECPAVYAASHYCPSVDAMLESLAQIYGRETLAIILSGMGNDGARAARQLRKKNAMIIVQDLRSSVVWGMPGAVARDGIANAVLNPQQMIRFLKEVAKR